MSRTERTSKAAVVARLDDNLYEAENVSPCLSTSTRVDQAPFGLALQMLTTVMHVRDAVDKNTRTTKFLPHQNL